MLGVSFYKPQEYFSGMFNRFVAWMTSGNFCHTELVIQAKPQDIMNTIKIIYQNAQSKKYHPDDCSRIISAIESNFFDNRRFRDLAQSSDNIWLSFSLLWGEPMFVRPLEKHHHDSWFRIPSQDTNNMDLLYLDDIKQEDILETLKFSIEELGKNYDTSGALCSWIPWGSSSKEYYDSYFCSEFVVTAFQKLGYMEELPATHTTPNTLYKYIHKNMKYTLSSI